MDAVISEREAARRCRRAVPHVPGDPDAQARGAGADRRTHGEGGSVGDTVTLPSGRACW